MSDEFKRLILAMSEARPSARVSTIVSLALAVEVVPMPDLSDAKALGAWAALQPEVSEYLPDKRIHAIKELRALTGASLAQAKFAIDTLRSA